MNQKGQLLLTFLKVINEKSSIFGFRFVVCGGWAIHILSDYFGRKTGRPWNHKDIDLQVPLSQLHSAIPFFKSIKFVKGFVPYKKARLVKNYYKFSGKFDGQKILVDVYGADKIPVIKIPWRGSEFLVISPRLELENWIDRKKRQGSRQSIELSIEFLEAIVKEGNYTEDEIR